MRVVVLAILSTSLAASGCKQKPSETTDAAAVAASALPPDHLAPGELSEGRQKAFALLLPRDVQIVREFPGVVHATSQTVRPEQVANYFRSRVEGGVVSAGASETKFVAVHAKGELTRELAIDVRSGRPGFTTCEVSVRDMTPPPFVPGLSDEERRKRAGLTPDGKILDPKHLE